VTNIGTTTEGTVYSVVDNDNDNEVYLTLATKDLSFKANAKDLTSEYVQGPLLITGCDCERTQN